MSQLAVANSGRDAAGVDNKGKVTLLAMLLMSPVLIGILRKTWPGQPNAFDVVPALLIPVVAMATLRGRTALPGWMTGPLTAWVFLQLLYVPLAAFEDWRVGAVSIATRILPVFLVHLTYSAVKSQADYRLLVGILSPIAPLMFPVGMAAALKGNEAMPAWLAPIDALSEVGRDVRSGIPIITGFFTTPWILSISMLGIMFYALAATSMSPRGKSARAWCWWVVLSAVLVIYLTGRRAVLTSAVIGLFVYMWSDMGRALRVLTTICVAVWVIGLFDSYGVVVGQQYRVRSELVLQWEIYSLKYRVTDIFWETMVNWMRLAPVGNYLGFAGPEVHGLGVLGFQRDSQVVETGASQLVAEMGVLGAMLFPLVVGALVWGSHKRSRSSPLRGSARMLLLFQIIVFGIYYTKELLVLSNVSMGQFLFWSSVGACGRLFEEQGMQNSGRKMSPRGMGGK